MDFKGVPRSLLEESRFCVGLRRLGSGSPDSAFLTTKNAKYREIGGIGIHAILHSNALKPDHYRDHVSSDPSSNLKTTGFLTTNEH